MLLDTLVAGDGKAAAIYVPIESKDESYRLSREIGALLEQETAAGEWHITGLPVAEDTFGNEMFVQMGISAPAGGGDDFFPDALFFPQPAAGDFPDDRGDVHGHCHHGPVDRHGLHGPHHELHDPHLSHAHSGCRLDPHHVGVCGHLPGRG